VTAKLPERDDETKENRFVFKGQMWKNRDPPDAPHFKIGKAIVRGLNKPEIEDFKWYIDAVWAKRTSSPAPPALPNSSQFRLRRTLLLGRLSTVEIIRHPDPVSVGVETFGSASSEASSLE
jgi:hypothetical protein